MSVVPSSDFSNSSSRVASGIQPDVLSRLHVRIVIDKSMLASVVADVVRLADVLLPDTAHFLVTENDSITLRVREADPPPLNWSTRYDSFGRTDNEHQTT